MNWDYEMLTVGDLVETDNDVGIITKLPYEFYMRIEDAKTKLLCFEVLWAGATHSSRVDYVALENGSIRVVRK